MSQPGVSLKTRDSQDLSQPESKKPNNIWCLGPESNRYVPFETQDFKSYHAFFVTRRFRSFHKENQNLKSRFYFGLNRSKKPVFGGSVSRVSAKFGGLLSS